MSVDPSAYNGANGRTLSKMHACRLTRSKDINKVKGCVRDPLVNIEPSKCVIDELHLFLRISDILIGTLFAELFKIDHKNRDTKHVSQALKIIHEHGVSFRVQVAEKTGKQSRSGVDFTSINRTDRLKILNAFLKNSTSCYQPT